MSEPRTANAEFCSDLVSGRDEDRWLSARYAPPELARKLFALYAFQCELRHIPSAVSEPQLGEIRLQWWRDAFSDIREGKNPRAHPVVEEISASGLAEAEFESQIGQSIDAAARPLYGEPFSDLADLEQWVTNGDSVFDVLAFKLCGGDPAAELVIARAGAAFAMAREGHLLAPDLGSEVSARVRALWTDVSAHLKEIPSNAVPGILHLSLTTQYLKTSARQFPLKKRVKLFSAMAFGAF